MRLRTRAALWAALAVGTSVGAPFLSAAGGPSQTTALSFAPRTFDFGSVRAGADVKVEFAFTNGSKAPIRIRSVRGSCGCVKVETSSSYVEPGAGGKITAVIHTTGREGSQSFRIYVQTDEGPQTGATLMVKGAIRVALRARPGVVSLGIVDPGAERTADVRVEKLEPVHETSVKASGDGVSVEKVAEDAKGLTLKITVKVPWKRATRGNGVTVTAAEGSAWIPVAWTVPAAFELSAKEVEIKGGKGEITAKPRWPGVKLAQVNVRNLPIEVARDGDRILFTLKDTPLAVPSGAMIELLPEPLALGSMRIPVYVRPE